MSELITRDEWLLIASRRWAFQFVFEKEIQCEVIRCE